MLAEQISKKASIVDVGCGVGTISMLLQEQLPSTTVLGLEVSDALKPTIPHILFDGNNIPLKDTSVDVCLFVDVLHHTSNIDILLREAVRVTKKNVLIKDHLCETRYDYHILKAMDWVGNRSHDIALIYNYKSKVEWEQILKKAGLKITYWTTEVPLYKFPLNKICAEKLHFIACLEK